MRTDELRLGILASGSVGLAAVDIAARSASASVVFVGVDEAADEILKADIRALVPRLAVPDLGPVVPPAILAAMSAARIDVLVLAWWPYIVREPLMACPQHGSLNFHPSLLPHNRGKDPNFWALVERRPYGVSIHWVERGVDVGDVAFQRELEVTWEDTGASLHGKATMAMVELFEESLPAILAGDLPRRPQGDGGSSHRRAELEPASLIDLMSRRPPDAS